MFDPYSDDPRLAVKKLAFCGESGRLVVGGTAGQVVICSQMSDPAEESSSRGSVAKICKADIVTEKEGFTWKGHQPLAARTGAMKQREGGWQSQVVLQISPPASITALTLHREWGVLAAGTAHGFVLLDFAYGHVISARSTLNAQDIANADDNPMSRRKSLKKSLRESFRRLRKGRSQRHADKKKTGNSPGAPSGDIIKRERADSPEARPVERQIEARGSSSEDGLGSMVRCLHFAQTFIAGPSATSPTLWAGTNSGQVSNQDQIFVFIVAELVHVDRRCALAPVPSEKVAFRFCLWFAKFKLKIFEPEPLSIFSSSFTKNRPVPASSATQL